MIDQEALAALADELRLRDAYLFGSAAFAAASGIDARAADLDLQAAGGAEMERDLLHAIEKGPFSLCSGPSDYWIYYDDQVRLFEVEYNGTLLDINLMDTTVRPGHFSLEAVRWEIRSGRLEDPFGVKTWRLGDPVQLVTSVDADNPLLMLSRMIKLANKYGLSLFASNGLGAVSRELTMRARSWHSDDDFHGRQAQATLTRIVQNVLSTPQCSSTLRSEIAELGIANILEPAAEASQV